MKTLFVLFKTIDEVKDFVELCCRYPFDIDLSSGRYIVDAKSIMGIFSLDLSKEIKVEIHSENCDELLNELQKYSS